MRGNNLREIEFIDQELTELRSRFKQSLEVLNNLAEIQGQFQDLAQTHAKLKEYVNAAEQTLQQVALAQGTMNRQRLEFEKGIEGRWSDLRQELFEVRNELENADRNLSEKLARQAGHLAEGNQVDVRYLERLERLEAHMYGAETYIRKLDRRIRTIRDILIASLIGLPIVGLGLWLLLSRI
jgi:DNA repair exonuclease SbcCD ATPase subunit